MKTIDIVRAWKDEDYRSTLTPAQVRELPANPAGLVALQDSDLVNVTGGSVSASSLSNPCPGTVYACGPTLQTTAARSCNLICNN